MIAERIKEIIKQKGTTSIDVAKKMNISRETFSRTINGNPTLSTLQNIADTIGCEVGDFFIKSEPIVMKINGELHTFYSVDELKQFITHNL